MKWTIQKAPSKEDFDNGNFYPSDGGEYSKEDALRILETAHGGLMTPKKGAGLIVHYTKSKNKWLRNQIGVK